MRTNNELLSEQLRTDPEFRAEWERTALARAVAGCPARSLTQRALLADVVGLFSTDDGELLIAVR